MYSGEGGGVRGGKCERWRNERFCMEKGKCAQVC